MTNYLLIIVVIAITLPNITPSPVPQSNYDSFTQRTTFTNHGPSAQSRITFGQRLIGRQGKNPDAYGLLESYNQQRRQPERVARRLPAYYPTQNTNYVLRPVYPIPGFGRAVEAIETMAPRGVFLPPESSLDLNVIDPDHRPDFTNGLEHPDPFLITGEMAKRVVAHLSKKELFFHEFPHVDALLRNNKERRENGLSEHYLSSSRYESPFFRNTL